MKDAKVLIRARRRFNVFERDGFRCVYCGRSALDGVCISVSFHEDHVHPRSRGGITSETNLVTACSDCNVGKGSRVLKKIAPGIPDHVRDHQRSYWDVPHGSTEGDCVPACAISDREKAAMFIFEQRYVGRSTIHRRLFKNRPASDVAEILSGVESAWPAFSRVVRQTAGRPCEVWFHARWSVSEFCGVVSDETGRGAAIASAHEAAMDLRFEKLDPKTESDLLERLLEERRTAQELLHGR